MDRGAAALYAARQCHQPDPAVDLAAQRRGQGADDKGPSHFLIDNMGLFFIPSVVGTLEYLDVLKLQLSPFWWSPLSAHRWCTRQQSGASGC